MKGAPSHLSTASSFSPQQALARPQSPTARQQTWSALGLTSPACRAACSSCSPSHAACRWSGRPLQPCTRAASECAAPAGSTAATTAPALLRHARARLGGVLAQGQRCQQQRVAASMHRAPYPAIQGCSRMPAAETRWRGSVCSMRSSRSTHSGDSCSRVDSSHAFSEMTSSATSDPQRNRS